MQSTPESREFRNRYYRMYYQKNPVQHEQHKLQMRGYRKRRDEKEKAAIHEAYKKADDLKRHGKPDESLDAYIIAGDLAAAREKRIETEKELRKTRYAKQVEERKNASTNMPELPE